ncbi:MAG: hypothetical protein LBR17_07880 [Bacteroidales bacterium]|jgi:hypothetical protein|nr:hypothetical protein [Bacteroidales bacterium]
MNDFFASWYELLAYFEGFSNDMYDNQIYLSIGLCMTLIPIAVLAIYYYAVNSVKFNRWWHWLLLVVVLCAANFGIAYSISYNSILDIYESQNASPEYSLSTDCLSFSLVNMLWCFAVSFVWSIIIKWGSSNCRRTPF